MEGKPLPNTETKEKRSRKKVKKSLGPCLKCGSTEPCSDRTPTGKLRKGYPFTCPLCLKTFPKKNNLTRHLKIHTGDRPFSCEFCGKEFIEKRLLERHVRTHTGERPFLCELCGKSFNQSGHLKLHKMQHTGEKPHTCQLCNKSFREKGNYNRHMLIHLGKRPHACCECGEAFIKKKALHKHLKMKHAIQNPDNHICLVENFTTEAGASVLLQCEPDLQESVNKEPDDVVEGSESRTQSSDPLSSSDDERPDLNNIMEVYLKEEGADS